MLFLSLRLSTLWVSQRHAAIFHSLTQTSTLILTESLYGPTIFFLFNNVGGNLELKMWSLSGEAPYLAAVQVLDVKADYQVCVYFCWCFNAAKMGASCVPSLPISIDEKIVLARRSKGFHW